MRGFAGNRLVRSRSNRGSVPHDVVPCIAWPLLPFSRLAEDVFWPAAMTKDPCRRASDVWSVNRWFKESSSGLRIRQWIGLAAVGVLVNLRAGLTQAQDTFPLKDGDTWIMAGDSITAQHLHSNYIEAFCYARFPKLTFCFRNSGVGGDTIPKLLARFDYDVAAWAPTVVSVELGMNDQGRFTT
jgi:hypothetical protein